MIRVNATVEDAVDERKRNGLEVGGGMEWAFRTGSWAVSFTG